MSTPPRSWSPPDQPLAVSSPTAAKRSGRLAHRFRLTREGKYFLAITLGVGFAAINTANNLLYLLLGMLLSLIIVSGVLSEISLRQLTVLRRLPPRAQVGRPHLVEIEVFNHKTRVPSYAIEVEDLRAGQPADKRCFFLKISPASSQIAAYRRTPARRGRDRHVGFRVATRFPFGLFEKSRDFPIEGDLIIYPQVEAVALPVRRLGDRDGHQLTLLRGSSEETLGLRLLREGDDPRDIHWRKSASLGQHVVRERAREAHSSITFTLDNLYPGALPTEDWSTRFERRIRELASLSVAHLKRGDTVLIRTTAGARVSANPALGADAILRFLALVEPHPAVLVQRSPSPVTLLPTPLGAPGRPNAPFA